MLFMNLTGKFMDSIMKRRSKLGLSTYPIDNIGNILKPQRNGGRLIKATRKDFRLKNFDKLYD